MKHILGNFEIKLNKKQQKQVLDTFLKHREWGSFMLGFQPIARTGIVKVAIISPTLGEKLKKIIIAHKSNK